MEWYIKALIATAVAVPVSVEMRTFVGIFGLSFPLVGYVVVGVCLAVALVAADELWFGSSETVEAEEGT